MLNFYTHYRPILHRLAIIHNVSNLLASCPSARSVCFHLYRSRGLEDHRCLDICCSIFLDMSLSVNICGYRLAAVIEKWYPRTSGFDKATDSSEKKLLSYLDRTGDIQILARQIPKHWFKELPLCIVPKWRCPLPSVVFINKIIHSCKYFWSEIR